MASDTASRRREAARARRRPRASLARRILYINAIGLGLLVGGVLYLNQFREGLIELRTEALMTQGRIVATAVAEAAGARGGPPGFDPVRANLVLRRLAPAAGVRIRLFDRSGRLAGDTRSFGAAVQPLEVRPLPPPGGDPAMTWMERLDAVYVAVASWFDPPPPLYRETLLAGVSTEPEVYAALGGEISTAVRANSEGELILSAALPLARFRAVMGALVLSTEGGDIDRVVRAERIAILRVFLVALAVSATLSALLAADIARPLRRLAAVAERTGSRDRRPVDPRRVDFPDYARRGDEIGELSTALRRMTEQLYARIDGIERFAADVAHEIKNPLSSLRSAVETMRRTEKPDLRERLLAVIEHDVRRLDRLVTDIANASRLDAELARAETETVDLAAMLAALAEIGAEDAEARGARIAVSAGRGLEVRGLETRLGQVFRNLLENAVSFSPPGGVVRVEAAAAGDGAARITVTDDGPGVPPERRAAIFERFHTERPEAEGFGDHSGLGLSIAKQIVEAHGGWIGVEPRPDGRSGARFVVELPK